MSSQPEPDIDRGVVMIAIYSVECLISMLVLGLRLCARWSIRGSGWDDVDDEEDIIEEKRYIT